MKESENLIEKGKEFSDKKDEEQAIFCFKQLIEKNPKNFEAWLLKGKSHFKLEEYEEALACFERAVKLNPKNIDACLDLGKSYRKTGNPFKELEQINKAIQMDSNDSNDWCRIGHAYTNLDQYENAITCLKKALEINPKNIRVMYSLAIIYGDYLGDPKWAIHYYEKLVDVDKSRSMIKAYAYLKLHKEYNKIGDTKKANEYLFKGDGILSKFLTKKLL
ncbi:MAG: tetratricopeptide repeat protein [Candidatus Lokiarchaeota archaeon]|nr:tetratricopeptide repeat protein [Candidatus Lokiarchaeota archaeon]